MAYCDMMDVQVAAGGPDQLIELTDQDRNGAVDGIVLDKAIARADALINTHVAKLFSIPVTPVPTELKERSAELAVYYLRKQNRALTKDDQDNYDAHMKWLKALADGEVTLDSNPLPLKSSLVVDKTLANVNTNGRARDGKKGYW